MKTNTQKARTWTYGRAFLLTLGIVLFSLVLVVWIAQGDDSVEWPFFAWCLLGAIVVGGIALCGYALRGLDSSIKIPLIIMENMKQRS